MSSIFDAIPKTESRPNYVVDIERFIGAPGSFTFHSGFESDLAAFFFCAKAGIMHKLIRNK